LSRFDCSGRLRPPLVVLNKFVGSDRVCSEVVPTNLTILASHNPKLATVEDRLTFFHERFNRFLVVFCGGAAHQSIRL